jgi:biotin transport system substrate-specific component
MNSFADVVRPSAKSQRILFDSACILGGSLFLALMAQCCIPLWFTPVPVTLQTLGVMLLGALLGSRKGALAVTLYVVEGAMGLPFFAGGTAGLTVLFGPTGGYLFSFIFSAFIAGSLLEKGWKNSYPLTLAAFALSSLLILVGGALWLSFFVGMPASFALGVYPFLIGCSIKVLIATAMIPSGWKALHYFK